jgi:16S rRNA (cytosine967-C5)-methyltransferase
LFGAVRHLGRLNAVIDAVVVRSPRARLRAVLLVAGFELLEAGAAPVEEGQAARIVHHAVAQAKGLLSAAEARLVNAVLRKLAAAADLRAAPPAADAGAAELARFFSHPAWLVRRWLAHFGPDATLRLLQWNQTPPPVYARWRAATPGDHPPAWLQPAAWPGFHVVPAGRWPEVERLLAAGALYLQDPSTLAAATLLDPQPGETVLDLCAAPGGKSLLLADLLEQKARPAAAEPTPSGGPVPAGTAPAGLIPVESAEAGLPAVALAKAGCVVAVDLPDARRIGRLKENLAKVRGVEVALVPADVLKLTPTLLQQQGLPPTYAAVLLDVPCSNTGVMRHRVDVKWRLREADIARHAAQQRALLAAAARLVAGPPAHSGAADSGPGGRLVYSTCSLEPEENEQVVEAFLRDAAGRFVLDQARSSRPWESGCDGGSAFLLRRIG